MLPKIERGRLSKVDRQHNYAQLLVNLAKDLTARNGKGSKRPHGAVSFGNGAAMRVSAVGWFFDILEETATRLHVLPAEWQRRIIRKFLEI